MRPLWRFLIAVVALLGTFVLYLFATVPPVPQHVSYGATFSVLDAEQLGLDWKQAYVAVLDDLGVRKLRLPLYWPMLEPSQGTFAWGDADFLLHQAQQRGASVIPVVGFRQPRWPECFTPKWAQGMSWDEQKQQIRAYITAVVERYRDDPEIAYWQVENEPYLSVFGECGPLDKAFLQEEIALVHSLDATHPVLVTDSGNLGLWVGPYRSGDAFGTSLYIYFWNQDIGQFKTKLPAIVYRLKERLMQVLFGVKPSFLIELSLEPWLTGPTASTSVPVQLERMDMTKWNEIIAYARQTSFDTQYLWGVEWWYYMKTKEGHPEFWAAGKKLFWPQNSDGTHPN